MADDQGAGSLGHMLSAYARRAEECLQRWLVEPDTPAALAEAMRYCVLAGGKRLRPAVVWMSGEAVGADGLGELCDRAAAAVEMVHCYSLVHDDLPAMDDDTLRRGRPTAHVQFGEAMAILAGDALLTRAFGVLGESPDPLSARLSAELARGAGPAGMIAGQVADMDLCDVPAGREGVRYIHLRKTAGLIRAAARMGALCARADEADLAAVSDWAEALGLAFQLIDDMLDATGSAEELGKTPGKDAGAHKRSAVAEMGLEQAAALGEELTRQAGAALEKLGPKADNLHRLTRLLVRRSH